MGEAQANKLQALRTGLPQRQVNENPSLIHLRVHFQIQLPEIGQRVAYLNCLASFAPLGKLNPEVNTPRAVVWYNDTLPQSWEAWPSRGQRAR